MPWPLNVEKYGEFDQHNDWGFVYSSVPPEASSSYEIGDIEGQIPADLSGAYYKAGPGNFEREGRRYAHVLDGDGFVAAFHFDNGKARYTGRFVETEYFVHESLEDKIKYRNVFGTQRSGSILKNAFDLVLKNVANTNVVKWGGRLFALWEAGRPYELDPDTLETLKQAEDGPYEGLGTDARIRGITVDHGGQIDKLMGVGRAFTAHPHILDDDTMVAFKAATSVTDKKSCLEFLEYNKNWEVKKSVDYSFDVGPPPHDFSISEIYYCFFENPFGAMDNVPYLFGVKAPTQIMQLLLRRPAILHLVPRHSSAKAMTVEVAPYFNIHNVPEAIERDGKLYLYSNGWDLNDRRFFPDSKDSVPFLGSWGGLYPDFINGVVPPSFLYETVVDLQSETTVSHKEVAPGVVMEFPVSDPNNSEVVYCTVAATDYTSLPGTGLCKMNVKTSEVECWWAENKVFTHEVTPVSKLNGEAGCWLLTLFYDSGKKRTSLAIFDSEKFHEGPVCRLHLKHHLSYGLHGSFSSSLN
ncbi:hypothetical protein FisN_22Hh188 [Fistulifera solaris]|uniref:Uncharacterized protein n=1 Tax=Fistulifera solaris TaxID=1519565 RepID=A0A1Z5JQ44_FISSO|nr:hypothetical protein FisN_22Hh188 [Fistulifera solaris]|eukprot:GAX15962.1 hypothetical protein FisN_22Hh188 [Fistulifera solaris]